jgi:hypothetical protein
MSRTGRTESDLTAALNAITDLAEESLDPELSREEVVRRMKDIANFAEEAAMPAEELG